MDTDGNGPGRLCHWLGAGYLFLWRAFRPLGVIALQAIYFEWM
jgi:hypothetical protein